MDPDSLDWIWENYDNSSKLCETTLAGEFDDDDFDFYDRCDDDDDGSDTSSDSSVGCSLMVGDKNIVGQLNAIVDDIDKQNGGGDIGNDEMQTSESVIILNLEGLEDGHEDFESNINKFYDDALEVTKNKLSEVRQLWTDALYTCTVNE